MFLKIATIVAILGVAMNLLLSLIQQSVYAAHLYGDGIMVLMRIMNTLGIFLLNGGLLIFLVAFLLSLRSKTT